MARATANTPSLAKSTDTGMEIDTGANPGLEASTTIGPVSHPETSTLTAVGPRAASASMPAWRGRETMFVCQIAYM